MPREKALVEASLTKKGFKASSGDHNFFIYHTLDGKKTPVRTKTSFTPKMKDISDPLIAQMAKQCKLTKQKFLELVDCSLDHASYEAILKDQRAI